MSTGVHVKSWRHASKMHARVLRRHLKVEACLPERARGKHDELVASMRLDYEEESWSTQTSRKLESFS